MDKELSLEILRRFKVQSLKNALGLKPGDIIKHKANGEYGVFVGIKPKRPAQKEVMSRAGVDQDGTMYIAITVSKNDTTGDTELRTRYITPKYVELVEHDGILDLIKNHCERDCILDCDEECLLWKLKQNMK